MPKSSFSTGNVRSSGTSFPVLKMDKLGDNKRIKLAEAEPTFEWVHNLRKPKLSAVTGQLVMKTIEVGKDGDKELKEVPDLDYVGSYVCLGTDDVLSDRGFDPDHCVMCKGAKDYPDYFDKPERKWAVHVFEYACQGNTSKPQEPISIQVKVFKMTEKRYARVVAVLEEFAPDGNILDVDLTLGPCTSQKFQNYEIQGAPRSALASSPKKLAEAQEIFENNNAGDLTAYCGRRVDAKYVTEDVEDIKAKWDMANSGGREIEEPDFSATLSSALLDKAPAAAAPAAKQEVPAASLDDLDSTIGAAEEKEEAPAAAPVKEEAPSAIPVAEGKAPASFSDLMSQMGVDLK